jgi:hypothetical protein
VDIHARYEFSSVFPSLRLRRRMCTAEGNSGIQVLTIGQPLLWIKRVKMAHEKEVPLIQLL